ncbi:hypothetical protein CAP36_11005 [Chitinophagaceae bacterium IBVUCB2]|nr:hypothetical protein CAP36_11005 [Chitinophagaceae bacterium IBVUCB2]
MKKLVFFAALFLVTVSLTAQINHSGTYAYSFKPQGDPPKTEADKGPTGKLVLLRMDGNKYRFWLDVGLGWPNYHVGETDGTIFIVNDTASFDNTFEDASHPCILKFKIESNKININSLSSSFNCGFGSGVNADGDYTKLAVQPTLNNEWLKKEYYNSPRIIITSPKAEIFQDESCLHSFTPKRFFNKGDNLINISETEKTVYTEFIPSPGKLIYGWIKKSEVKSVPAN